MIQAAAGRQMGFHLMAKPAGARCNLECRYCFYLEKEALYAGEDGAPPPKAAMPDAVLEAFVRDYIAAQPGPVVQFAWQGGEPTVLGPAFFERAVALQQQYAGGKVIENSFQTNGLLLDDRWMPLFKAHRFLIGVSIDGPADIHDAYRVDKGGKPTHARVMRAIRLLQRHGVPFNTLTCVHRGNAKHGKRVYRFLREIGSTFPQFIPVVERIAEETADSLSLPHPGHTGHARVAPWAVRPAEYGTFMCAVFDEWVRHDVGRVFVQAFEVALEAWTGRDPSLCVHSSTCGHAMALEHNGDVYACDHFVYPEYRLGNLMETPLAALAAMPGQQAFGEAKAQALPGQCRACPVKFACNGGCPKHRFLRTKDGEPGLNYLCEGYFAFFNHVAPYMAFMANELAQGRSPASVMNHARRGLAPSSSKGPPTGAPGPNDRCPCGSGRKYKKCCGGSASIARRA